MKKTGTFEQQDNLYKVNDKLNNAKSGQWFELKEAMFAAASNDQEIIEHKGVNIHYVIEFGDISVIAIF